jgi:hypothetical protein
MHRSSKALFVGIGIAAWCGVGCGEGEPTGDKLGVEESALVEDSGEIDDLDAETELGLEEPASGAPLADPGAPPLDGTTNGAGAAANSKTNIGLFFKPAGCIVSTVTGNVVTHVFTNCTGPQGYTSFNGTVVSTWSLSAGKLSVKHVAQGFRINGATVDHTVTVDYTKQGTVYTKHRVGETTGITKAGKPITHHADYTTTYDTAARCITRDGSSETTVGNRGVSRTIAGYKRCGIGSLGCPDSGVYTVTRKALNLTIKIEFPGGATMKVTLPGGRVVTVPLLCNAA